MYDRDAEVECGPLAMLDRRRDGRELSEMTVHPENIVSGGSDSPQAALSRPVIEWQAARKIEGAWQFYSANLSELTVPPGPSRCQARKRRRVDLIVLPVRVDTRAIPTKGSISIS